MTSLYDPLRLGDITLANRIVMAPLTRNRAGAAQVPTELMVQYYRQRANPATGAGLIITEATQVCPMGQGYLDTPGIHSAEQVAAWRAITDAVHAEGGRIVVQLWHVGRISHSSLLPGGAAPVSSTNRAAQGKTFTKDGFVDCSAPRMLRLALREVTGVDSEALHEIITALPPGHTISGSGSGGAPAPLALGLPGQPVPPPRMFYIGRSLERGAVLGLSAAEQEAWVRTTLGQLLPLYRFIVWSRENDFVSMRQVLDKERTVRRQKGLHKNDRVRIVRGMLAGKDGLVQEVEAKGQLKVLVGKMVIKIDAADVERPDA